MKIKLYLPAIAFLALLNSCTNKIYAPALHNSDIAYMPKPMSSDSVKTATYISGAFVSGGSPNLADDLTSGQLNISQAHTFNHFNLAYGAFGSAGNYHNNLLKSTDPYYFTNKFFGAVGGRLSGNFFINNGGRTDFRLIGFEAVYSHEFGSYAQFRKAVSDQPGFYTNNRTDKLTAGVTSEIIFHTSKPTTQFGFRLFLGGNIGDSNVYTNQGTQLNTYTKNDGYFSFAYLMQIQQYFGIVEFGGAFAQLRAGIKF